MGAAGDICSSLNCELKILQARNVEINSPSNLFVRFYLSAGNNRKIELNSEEICTESDFLVWNQSFSLGCQGSEAAIEELKQEGIVFELRRRKPSSYFRKLSRSELVGRGEVSWKSVYESKGLEMERWVVMGPAKDRILEDGKPPSLKIYLKVEASQMAKEKTEKKKQRYSEDLCGCGRDCETCNCADYEALFLVV
ncbi:PREDICTED: uncharacterized protein LOC104804926 [Tarenaya hassleriana]|uniref:uncharacterized protein LOC104804926 n=1 Tax=Tarenaya hassleriana TaxID=28532 RepID=UPI00053C28AA|nr:PREDICTED: uncharacterized protein LOC104804926 [Tarenaya hassleriana]